MARSIRELELSVRREWGFWQGCAVQDVRAARLEEWASALAGRGLSPATVRSELARFRAFFAWLYAREDVARIPAFPTVHVPRRDRATLSWEEQEAVLAEIAEQHRGAFLALAELALRPQEVRAMLAVDLDPEAGAVHVRRAAKDEGIRAPVAGTKTGTERTLPLPPGLAAWARRWIAQDARLRGALAFPSPGGRMWAQDALREEWRRASARAGVRYVALRDATRHSTAQEWRRSGAEVGGIRDLLGHTTEATTRIYLGPAVAPLVGIVSARRKRGSES